MGNGQNDIGVRIFADHGQATKEVQQFVGTTGKAFEGLPKIIEKAAASVDALTGKVGKMEDGLSHLPSIVQKLTGSIDTLSSKVDRLGSGNGVSTLNQQLSESNTRATTLATTFERIKNHAKAVGAAAAGFTAGKMVFQPHMERMVDYDTKLAHLVNVGYADKSVSERIAGKGELNRVINSAVRFGGGTRDSGVDTLARLMSSGTVSDNDAKTMLPSILKAATASGAGPDQIADIGIRSMQNFGFKASDLPRVVDMAIKSGNLGGFELKDMAKWLPAQMAEAATLGMKGEKGLAQLLALNQASITTAGSTDAAGNNVVNLLSKINSSDTQHDFKKQGIDLTGSLQKAVGKGIDPITAFSMLVDRVMSKDKNYLALEKKRKSATSTEEQSDILEKQLQLAEGTAIGKVLQDRQARGAFLGYKKQGSTFNKQVDEVLSNSAGTTEGNFSVVSDSPGFKRQQALNDQLDAQNEALKKLVPALNAYWEGTSSVAREFPLMTAALEGGKIAFTTVAAGAGAASIVLSLLTKNAAGAAVALGAIPGAGGVLTGGGYGANMGRFGKGMNLIGAGVLGWEVGTLANDYAINPAVKSLTGGKSDTLGTWLYNSTHPDEFEDKTKVPSKLPVSGYGHVRRFGEEDGISQAAVEKMLNAGLKPEPVKAQIGLTIGYDESGRPRVTQQSINGKNVDLSTGPMMMN